MNILIAQLIFAGLIPALLVFLLPKNPSFFQKEEVKGFAIGVYSTLVIMLIRESFEHSGIVGTFSWFGLGLFFSFIIGLLVREFHHHHTPGESVHVHTRASTIRVFISDFFHNAVDGIAVSAGGFMAMVGILSHQTVQQFGQQILLVESGMKPYKALIISFFVSLSIFTPLILNHDLGESVEPIFIALSAGIVSWKVIQDLSHINYTKKYVAGFLIGAFLIALSLVIIPHAH